MYDDRIDVNTIERINGSIGGGPIENLYNFVNLTILKD